MRDHNLLNPYESPRTFDAPRNPSVSSSLIHTARIFGLAFAGYGSFSAFAWCYGILFQLEAIDWSAGWICALAFAASEFLLLKDGKQLNLTRRIITACTIMVFSIFATSAISDLIGWNRTTYHHDPWLMARFVLNGTLFTIGVWGARWHLKRQRLNIKKELSGKT